MIPVYYWPSEEAKNRIKSAVFAEREIGEQVNTIVEDVRLEGDGALLYYTEKYDGCRLTPETIRVTENEIEAAYGCVEKKLLESIREAKKNILAYHERQKQRDWFSQDAEGSITGQIFRPLSRVGIYVPGGTAVYPSSVLMTSLPAIVAGVPEIAMVSPGNKEGIVPPVTLVAAHEAGIEEIYRVGGAQAISALAYGTKSICSVDKIVGPGNIYVTIAKKMIYGAAGIDMLAGPSEILIIGDGSVEAHFAAADLLSQAEHDKLARALLITPNHKWALDVRDALREQLLSLPRKEIATCSLQNQGAIIIANDLEEAFRAANSIAPEHLELLFQDPWPHLAKVRHAGAVFLGPYTPEALGDYGAGPNHVLPTGGSARYASGLSVDDFYKKTSLICYSKEGLAKKSAYVKTLATAENLDAHATSVAIRLREDENT